MEGLSRVLQFSISPSFPRKPANTSFFPQSFSVHHPHQVSTLRISVLRTPSSASERVEDDVLEDFFRDRQINGDFVTRITDIVFERRIMRYGDAETMEVAESSQPRPIEEVPSDEHEGGFLKLTTTQDWLLGETSAPINRKPTFKELQDDRDRRRRLELLKYEALKRELLFMTIGVGAVCTGYCLLTLSVQAAVSYAVGVGCSCLYLQLLCQHADNLSKDSVPQIFMKKKQKKIGIRSEDLEDFVERSVKGTGLALSSPRLVIPSALYGFWVLFHRNFAVALFDFQIVPAMLGLFAYKAAALVQVYRDNEDLKFIFAEDEENFDG